MKNQQQKSWADRSPEERKEIEKNRSKWSLNNPFNGKNQAQRRRLLASFDAMR